MLLVGSQGRIGLVVVVKIEPLKADETTIQNGFVQVYKYDRQMNRRVTHGGRMVKFYYASFSS